MPFRRLSVLKTTNPQILLLNLFLCYPIEFIVWCTYHRPFPLPFAFARLCCYPIVKNVSSGMDDDMFTAPLPSSLPIFPSIFLILPDINCFSRLEILLIFLCYAANCKELSCLSNMPRSYLHRRLHSDFC